jgi:hypothetical protein
MFLSPVVIEPAWRAQVTARGNSATLWHFPGDENNAAGKRLRRIIAEAQMAEVDDLPVIF